jgi:hypothetical protein
VDVSRWRYLIVPIARSAGLRPSLLAGLVQVESGGREYASSGGAYGLAQLEPSTFAAYVRVHATNLYNPRLNLIAASRYLSYLLRLAHGDASLALAYYNAGPNAPESVLASSEHSYAARVLSAAQAYRSWDSETRLEKRTAKKSRSGHEIAPGIDQVGRYVVLKREMSGEQIARELQVSLQALERANPSSLYLRTHPRSLLKVGTRLLRPAG